MFNYNICLIIVTYNPIECLKICLNSISKSAITVDVLLIDNNSTYNFEEILSNELNHFNFKLIKLNKNLGFGQANNIGFKYALENNYDYVFLLNQDAYIQEKTIKKLITLSQKYPKYGILSPMHLNGNGTRLDLNFSNYINESQCDSLISDFIIGKEKKEVYDLSFVNAAAWLIPIDTLKTIGGFDPIFFHYGEDNNYCQRALYHGLKIGIVPGAFIRHDRNQIIQSIDRYDSPSLFEKNVKVKCGDINESFQKTANWEEKELKRRIFISLLSLNVFGFKKWIKLYSYWKSIFHEIEQSRKINKIKGPNYLNG